MFASAYGLRPTDDASNGGLPERGDRPGPSPAPNEDLAYKIELLNASGDAVDQVLAVTSSVSIGYAAYYAATREFPDAVIILRHKNSVISKWGGKPN